MKDPIEQAKVIDTFLKFSYCFPMDIKDRFIEYYGNSMGNHFYNKFRGYCQRKENTFVAMVYTYGDMTNTNQALFMEIVNDYYKES